ncbi:MAG: T9SS type B sorting domain-containing protein [Bacteroidetes bacterium]|nr:T9SS type B sorting domain-containing protein [Bacteroidota bacterium]
MRTALFGIFFCFILGAIPFLSKAQCSINSLDHACVDEPMSFGVTSSSTVTKVDWNFGDGNTSNLTTPFHRFTTAGTYNVKASVTFSGGGTCDTTKVITVYNNPVHDLKLDAGNSYCLTQNKVCLNDNSTSGNSGVVNTIRTVLWGDGGKTDTNFPQSGGNNKVCYTYGTAGKYTITVETTNDKGCKSKEQLDIEVLFDFIPKFTNYMHDRGCDTQTNIFNLDTNWFKFKSSLVSLDYDMGDGTTYNTTVNDSIIHVFRSHGAKDVTLTATLKNGCKPKFTDKVDVILDRIEIHHQKLDSVVCYPGYFEFNHPIVPGTSTRYTWTAYNLEKKPLTAFGGTRNSFFFPDTPGKYYIGLEIKRGDCASYMMYDSVESVGVRTYAKPLNGSQCEWKDTVYFANFSVIYGTDDVSWFWNYNDTAALPCTTDTKNHLNVDANCNYSVDSLGKHFYHHKKCDEIWFYATDNINGCKDSMKYNVILGKPDLNEFKYEVGKACVGTQPGYGVKFSLESCFGEVKLNLDSTCKRDSFVDWRDGTIYLKTCDDSGWVSLGVSARTGDNKIYRSADTTDYYFDDTKVCEDTLWIHNAYKIEKGPKPQFSYHFDGCIPSTFVGSLFIKQQPNVRWMYFDWDDGETDTVYIPIGVDTLPNFTHTYRRSGVYYPDIVLETDSGCREDQRIERQVGWYNDYRFNDLICPGTRVFFNDTVTNWEDTNQWWRHPERPERIYWEWDGAIGPPGGPRVWATFDTPGVYHVSMITMDKQRCYDTMTKTIVVTDVIAGIHDVTKKIICDDILQLNDSSFALQNIKDSLIYYYWDFGDGKTPSFLKNPFHFYSGNGDYEITHIVANTVGCKDTATTKIHIEGPVPQFDIVTDTIGCAPFTAEFKSNSKSATEFIWYFGDASSSANTLSTLNDSNVHFTYKNPGVYYIYLYAGDSVVNPDNGNKIYYCSDVFPDSTALNPAVRKIIVLDKPPADFTYSGKLCKNGVLTLVDNSDTTYTYYRWFIGTDSTVGPNKTQEYILKDSGAVTITYIPTYVPDTLAGKLCFDTITKSIPVGGDGITFNFDQEGDCPTYTFTADKKTGTIYNWDFGQPERKDNHSNASTITHAFAPDSGTFNVCLYYETGDGCVDTLCTDIHSDQHFEVFIPNVFTPNDDGYNDIYDILIDGEDYYSLEIYSRWGELIYKSHQDYGSRSVYNWDGTIQDQQIPCPPGTYYMIFKYRIQCVPDSEIQVVEGFITLIRD